MSIFHPHPHPRHSRPVDPLKLKTKARLRLELEAAALPHKALAYGAGIDEAQLSRILSDHHGDDLAAYRLPAIVRELGPGLLEWLALQCGGIYQHGAPTNAREAQAAPVLVGLLAHQTGDLLQQLIRDLADTVWSSEERAARIVELRQLRQIVEALLLQAEATA